MEMGRVEKKNRKTKVENPLVNTVINSLVSEEILLNSHLFEMDALETKSTDS